MNRYQKQITHPFNEKLRNRIFSPLFNSVSISTSSSGSEHDAVSLPPSPSPSPSPCLSYLVQNFLENDSRTELTKSTRDSESGSDSDSGGVIRPDLTSLIHSVIFPSIFDNVDTFRKHLLANVNKAVEIFVVFRRNKSIFHRNLMSYLRETGYNAGVCKIRWNSTSSLTSGNYEVIDVISMTSSSTTRYVIDTEFSGEFEIARETERYANLRSSIPRVFVGREDDVKRIVRLMCDEGRRSLKMNGLISPPWRKNRYMQMKWLGPYRRTVNHLPVKLNSPVVDLTVNCRFVGFDVAVDCFASGYEDEMKFAIN